MTSKERILKALAHESPDRIPIDFGATPVTGIHVLAIERLREHFGFEKRPVRVIEPYQMLGEIDPELMDALQIDVIGLSPKNNMFGIENSGELKEFETFWGQTVLVPKGFNTSYDEDGNEYGDDHAFPLPDLTRKKLRMVFSISKKRLLFIIASTEPSSDLFNLRTVDIEVDPIIRTG